MSKAKVITVAAIGTAVIGSAIAGIVVAKKKGHIANIMKAKDVNAQTKEFEKNIARATELENVVNTNNETITKNSDEIENLDKVIKRAKADTKQAKDALAKRNKLADETNEVINKTNDIIDEYNELNSKIKEFAEVCTDVNNSVDACKPWALGWAGLASVGAITSVIVCKVVK